jgi:hypothetical protein
MAAGRGGTEGGGAESLLASLRSGLGLNGNGGGGGKGTVREAERLASAYATELESHLRENGKWERVIELA